MNEVLRTLYIQNQGAYLALDHDTVRVMLDDQPRITFPLIRIDSLVLFGNVSISPFLIHRCADDGRAIVWLNRYGRFKARIAGHVRGNVLLRYAQHRCLHDATQTVAVARAMVAGKLQNSRHIVVRAARDTPDSTARRACRAVADQLARNLLRLKEARGLNDIRGIEGESARGYFSVFPIILKARDHTLEFDGRSRRPPRDQVNALLSFLYTLLRHECESALEGLGIDPQVGFLHALRPGRPALALDLMEELRSVVADRLALTLLNRRQLTRDHFESQPGGAVFLNDEGRRALLNSYEARKEELVQHRLLDRDVPIGLLPHIQARILARYLRRDIEHYIPYIHR